MLSTTPASSPSASSLHERDAVTERALEVNLGGTALGCKLALERLLPRDTGHIVNVASGLGRTPLAGGATLLREQVRGGRAHARRSGSSWRAPGSSCIWCFPGWSTRRCQPGSGACAAPGALTPDEVAAAIVDAIQFGRAETLCRARSAGWWRCSR